MQTQAFRKVNNWTGGRMLFFLFFLCMAMLSLQRAALFAIVPDRFADASREELLQSVLVGLRFDATISGMLSVPMWAMLLVFGHRALVRPTFRRTVAIYGAAALTLLFLLCAIDFFFFIEFGERLNHKAVHYLQYDYVYKIVAEQFPMLQAAIGALLLYWLLQRLLMRLLSRSQPTGNRTVLATIGGALFSAALLALCIRGSIGPKAINTGPAYFTASTPLAQLSLNGPFTLRETLISLFEKSVELDDIYPVIDDSRALQIAKNILAQSQDRFRGDADNPLRRITDTGRPERNLNVVLVVMESLSWPYIGAMGGQPDLTPNLSALAAEGTLFDRCFAVGKRTTRGFSGIVAGFPDLPGDSVTTRHQSEHNFLTIGSVLARRGYDTLFIYGGQPHYDHRQAFLGSNGFRHFIFEQSFASHHFRTHLGWSDEDLFNTAHEVFSRRDPARPFLATLLTLSFHRPYDIPAGRITPSPKGTFFGRQVDAVRYVDWAIGRFMEKARSADYYKNTIFVFAADHMGGFKEHPSTVASFRIPFLIVAPGIESLKGKRVSSICSQTDIAPTVLSLLGGRYEHSFFGSSVLDRPPASGVALIQTSDQQVHLIDGHANVVTITPHGMPPKLSRYRAPDRLFPVRIADDRQRALTRSLQTRAMALLQSAEILFRRGTYTMHDAPGKRSPSLSSR